MKFTLLAIATLTLASCASFDAVPTASFDPATGQWVFSAKVAPAPVEPTK